MTRMRGAAALREVFVGIAFVLSGCGYFPEHVKSDDPRVVELLAAANAFDRSSRGFSPIDPKADLRLEWRPHADYDAMLHIYDHRTEHTIAFRRGPAGFEWMREQEIFRGPREYETPDGKYREQIAITCSTPGPSTTAGDLVYVSFDGDDPRLKWPLEPTLADVRPILEEWGFGRR